MKLSKLFMLVIFLVLFSQFSFSIGISPAKRIIDFEANKAADFSFNIVNNEHKEFTAIVYARGELENYFKIKTPVLTFKATDDKKKAELVLEMPENIGKPGGHITEIVVLEYPSQIKSDTEIASIQAIGSVVAKVNILVPYPGKYAEADVHIAAAGKNENVVFSIPIFNYGKEKIISARAVIRILGATYEKIAEFETEKVSIEPQGQAKLTSNWIAEVNPGTYHAVIEVLYDDEKIIIEKNFNVGTLLVDIEKIETGPFSLGQVARFDITIASKWNELIPNVYGDITVSDKKGTDFGTFKTASVDIKPFEREIITAYWDTKDAIVGEYNLKVAIHYNDKVTEKLIDAEVNIDSIRTSLSPTAKVAAAKSGSYRDSMLVILVISLVIINIGWFIYFKKFRKK